MKSEESLGSGGVGGGGEWEWVMGERFGRASVHCIFELGLMANKYASAGVACCQMCIYELF